MTGTQRFDKATGGSIASMSTLSSIVVKVCTALLTAAVLGGAAMFNSHGDALADAEKRLSLIEATRYTRSDAQNDQAGLKETLTAIRVTLASMDARLKGLEAAIKKEHR